MRRKPTHRVRRSQAPRPRPRGLTLIEVVIALATLVVAAGALLGGSTFIANIAARSQVRLDATEVAHRVLLQHMEDTRFWDTQPKRTELNGRYYAFTLAEEVVLADDMSRPPSGLGGTSGGGGAGVNGTRVTYTSNAIGASRSDDRLKPMNRVVVRVYPDDDNTGPAAKIAAAEITRYYMWHGAFDEEDVLEEVKRRFGAELDQSGLGAGPGGR